MKNGARYVVSTHWGTFSLDEGSYQDYLAAKLWICWTPGKPAAAKPEAADYVPPHVTNRAVELQEQADRNGILETLKQLGIQQAIVPYSQRLADLPIDEMNLTVRASNGLKRANIHTFCKLKAVMEKGNGISSIRNLGAKSEREIKTLFFTECYTRLLPFERAQYWQEMLDTVKNL